MINLRDILLIIMIFLNHTCIIINTHKPVPFFMLHKVLFFFINSLKASIPIMVFTEIFTGIQKPIS